MTCWTGTPVDDSDCPTPGSGNDYFIVPMHFTFPTGGPYTIAGTIDQYNHSGDFESSWTYTATATETIGVHKKKVVLYGTVLKRKCDHLPPPLDNKCVVVVVPANRETVLLRGAARVSDARTNSRGRYSFSVKPGSYRIAVVSRRVGRAESVAPTSRVVDARRNGPASIGNLDFTLCHNPLGDSDRGCDLVEINGSVVDMHGAAYSHPFVEVGRAGSTASLENSDDLSDQGYGDATGHFMLFAPRGRVDVRVSGNTPAAPAVTVSVDATRAVNTVAPLQLLPGISVNTGGRGGTGTLYVNIGQLPSQPYSGDHFLIFALHGHGGQECTFGEAAPVTTEDYGHSASFQMFPNADGESHSAFCRDTYSAVLDDSDLKEVVSGEFTTEP